MSNNHPVVKSVLASLPNFLSTNARSLYQKIDEFALLLNHLCVEIAAVSETWLHHGIENDIQSIANYNLIRQDRSVRRVKGVCAFVSNSIPYKLWTDLENLLNGFYGCPFDPIVVLEILNIVMGILYCPPPWINQR